MYGMRTVLAGDTRAIAFEMVRNSSDESGFLQNISHATVL
jgi:hypothetical protein